jgi:hypothetical protein
LTLDTFEQYESEALQEEQERPSASELPSGSERPDDEYVLRQAQDQDAQEEEVKEELLKVTVKISYLQLYSSCR